jgi:hypothetical protein
MHKPDAKFLPTFTNWYDRPSSLPVFRVQVTISAEKSSPKMWPTNIFYKNNCSKSITQWVKVHPMYLVTLEGSEIELKVLAAVLFHTHLPPPHKQQLIRNPVQTRPSRQLIPRYVRICSTPCFLLTATLTETQSGLPDFSWYMIPKP